MKKINLLIAFVLLTSVAFSQGKLMNKLVAKVAAVVGNSTTVTATSLDDVTLTVGIGSNLHPSELGTIAQQMYKDWTPGGDQVVVMFTHKTLAGVCKVDGSVTVNGTPVQYGTAVYSLITAPSSAPRKIEITTLNGQKSSFTIAPNEKQLKVLSINGQKDKISLDLSKDVVVELDVTKVPANTMLKVSLAINQLSIKSQYDVCYLRSGSTITIPAAAFRNINIAPANGAVYSYKNSFLSVGVEELVSATDVTGSWSSVPYTSYYSDGKFVTVTTEPNLNTGLVAKEKVKLEAGEMSYDFFKPNAFTSRPDGQIKTIGMISYGMTGKTFAEYDVEIQSENLQVSPPQASISKRTTIKFPQQTDEVWANVLQTIYPELSSIIQKELGATLLPNETIAKTSGYKSIESYAGLALPDSNTDAQFSVTEKSIKNLPYIPFGEGYGPNSSIERIMKETGADALMTFKLDFQLGSEDKMAFIYPTITFELTGKINGLATNTKYMSGTVTGEGIPCDKIGLTVKWYSPDYINMGTGAAPKGRNETKVFQTVGEISPEELDRILRRTDVLTAFQAGLKDILAKEKANPDYVTVWDLQK